MSDRFSEEYNCCKCGTLLDEDGGCLQCRPRWAFCNKKREARLHAAKWLRKNRHKYDSWTHLLADYHTEASTGAFNPDWDISKSLKDGIAERDRYIETQQNKIRLLQATIAGADVLREEEQTNKFCELAKELFAKATPYGEDTDGFIQMYLIPAGPLHRLIGYVRGGNLSEKQYKISE